MAPAEEYDSIASPLPGAWELALWHAYDPANRVELHASALRTGGALFFIDPIPLAAAALEEMIASAGGEPAGVLVTNGNHARDAVGFATRFGVPLALSAAAAVEAELTSALTIPPEGRPLFDGALEAVPLPGGGVGEMAYLHADGGGLVMVGDALIHFPPHGFALLPDKYCEDPAQLRRSLLRLAARRFAVMAFAHGLPIVADADGRLRGLLAAL